LTGNRYNIAVAVFFVPYVIFEAPSNFAMKYFSPSVWIGRIMISWGIVTICTSAVSSFAGLLVVRFFLGVVEAGFFPGVVMYLCYWYKPSERATRLAIFAGSVAVAGAFSGLLATGISFLNGKANLAGWQWLFILTGIPAVLFGIVVWIYLPNYPTVRLRFCCVFGAALIGGTNRMRSSSLKKNELLPSLAWVHSHRTRRTRPLTLKSPSRRCSIRCFGSMLSATSLW
jgi:MFS family permease